MGHNPSRWKIRGYERAQIANRLAAEREICSPIIKAWNAHARRHQPPRFYPTIGAALSAEVPWLEYLCPGCGMIADIDIRTFDWHPAATISSLIPKLPCPRCYNNPPFARLRALRRFPLC
jgi:hypothetical protein